jgi:hypothetical protein
LVVIAGLAADVDGVFLFFRSDLFVAYHHTFGHSFVFGLPVALAAALVTTSRWRVGLAAMAAFALHLVADIVGSAWPVQPLYPASSWALSAYPALSSEVIYAIVNPTVALAILALTGIVMYRREVSPFEVLSSRLDRYAVYAWIYPLKYRCSRCGRRALGRCETCRRQTCAAHLQSFWRFRCMECEQGGAPSRS